VAHTVSDVSTPNSARASGAASGSPVALDDLVKSVRTVPVAPEILPKLQTKLLDVNTDVSDLSALIKLDAGLASMLLKVSNSAYYNRGENITSVEDAISLVGYQETFRLVARCSYATVMKGSLDFYGMAGEQVWEQAVLAAFSMEHLCEVTSCEISEGYMSGLLHGIGMVAINDHLNRSGRKVAGIASGSPADIARWEMETIGYTHAQVGGAMMRHWRYPQHIIDAIERQFVPDLSYDEPVLNCLLPLAVTIAIHVRQQTAGAPTGELVFDAGRAERAELDDDRLVAIADSVGKDWAKTRKALM
jgi:HD-like signal output (HDOD) protein